MDIVKIVEEHINEYKRLKAENSLMLRENRQYKRWLQVALRDCGGIAKLKDGERIEDFDECGPDFQSPKGRGIAFGSRECHCFDYYSSAPALADSGEERMVETGGSE